MSDTENLNNAADGGLLQPRLVRILECGRQSCGYVLTEKERDWKSDPRWESHRTAICPECGCDSFYTLDEKGQRITTCDREKYREGIDPTTLEPSPRMGPKKRQRILAVKQRILDANVNVRARPDWS